MIEQTETEPIRAVPGKKRDYDDSRDPATVEDRNNSLTVVNDPGDEALLPPGEKPDEDEDEEASEE